MNNKFKNNSKKIWNKITFFCKSHWTTPFKLMLFYILFIIVGSCLLYLPCSLAHGYNRWVPNDGDYGNYKTEGPLTFWDSMFIVTSAFTNTGLSVTDINHTYTGFGQFIIYTWIQLGGFGLLSFFYLVGKAINNMGKKFDNCHKRFFNQSFVGLVERSGTKISNSGTILFVIFIINLIIQIFFSFIISFIVCYIPFDDVWRSSSSAISAIEQPGNRIQGYHNYGLALWKSIFLVGSSINNAGLDLFGSYSLAIFRNDVGILVQIIIILLFTFGGIGYTCVYDIHKKTSENFWRLISKIGRHYGWKDMSYKIEPYRISILTKICLWMALTIGISSIGITYITEYASWGMKNNNDKIQSLLSQDSLKNVFNNSIFSQNFYIFFSALSTRSAGFTTVDCNYLQDATKWLFIILMFIGTSPSSTGGGIRTTTLAIGFKTIIQRMKNGDDPSLFKRRISKTKSIESFQIFSISAILIFIATILVLVFDNDQLNTQQNAVISTTNVIFELSSSFGTTGLSAGVTNSLNWFSMLIIMIIMFVGQLGITNTITAFSSKYSTRKVNSFPDLELVLG